MHAAMRRHGMIGRRGPGSRSKEGMLDSLPGGEGWNGRGWEM